MDKKVFLVADAEEAMVRAVDEALRAAHPDCTVYCAFDGAEALAKMKNVPPQVLVAAFDLPKISGSELLQTVMKEKELQAVGVVLLSELPDPDAVEDGASRGRMKLLSRPEGKAMADLLVAVNALLGSSGAPEEFVVRHLEPGEILFREGEAADRAYLVKRGKLRALVRKMNRRTTLGEIQAGEFVGEMAHINREPRSADVEAVEASELIEVPLGALDLLVVTKPVWARALIKTLSRRLGEANRQRT